MSSTADVIAALESAFGDDMLGTSASPGQESVTVQAAQPLDVLTKLRDEHGFDQLIDITATDCGELEREWDFEIVYFLRRGTDGTRFRLNVAVIGRDKPKLPTSTTLYANAAWPERELAEMFGITFKEHPDPRRLLLPDSFDAKPMRKDYAVAGAGERDKFPELGKPEAGKPEAGKPEAGKGGET